MTERDKGRQEQLEAELHERLTAGEMDTEKPDEAVRRRIAPRTEIRIQTTLDPIVEETNRYRSIAEEVDDRYDQYMKRAKRDGESRN
ncbi:hypothetical protein M5X00_19245 [Paenibacillus alvei]|uniref:hypothetical protein n=1 Tax=Paenibacillus TaxID=44249 RepID=UPI0002EA8622|nr:hypothetical protein [Paenibacillus alvei]MCY9541344.1 hypothetical protein [Paenibacillus alvei]MCY9702749.1 hypothetical protein [Paenibacillus alvei]MCY9734199.1 hypothetical protein [Paenibacillus alvei]MCY9756379.1 hypothetical protein [Paenibacillus alvei]MEC0079064.1 hypothetical protein [Paenibacillus alvei]